MALTPTPRQALALACTAFVAVGVQVGALGVVWPSMREDLDRPLGDLGLLSVLLTAGFGLSALAHGRTVRILAPGAALAVAGALYAAGCLAFALGSWPVVVAGAVVLGAAAGELEAALNAHVAARHGVRAMNLVHGMFGVGATLGPLLATALLGAGADPRLAFAAMAIVGLALAAGFGATSPTWAGGADRPEDGTVGGGGAERARLPGRTRWLLLAVLATFCAYTAIETVTGQWSFTLLTEDRGLDERAAGWVVSAYWAALTLGRFAIGAAGGRLTSRRVLDASVPAAALVVVVVAAGGPPITAAAIVVAGLCFAGVFPALVSLTPARFGPRLAASVMGWQLAAGAVGVGLGPAVAAVAVEGSGPGAVGPVLVGISALLLVAHLTARRLAAGARPDREPVVPAHPGPF